MYFFQSPENRSQSAYDNKPKIVTADTEKEKMFKELFCEEHLHGGDIDKIFLLDVVTLRPEHLKLNRLQCQMPV